MASSILTNNGAMTALQSLQATQKSLLDTQNRISTGLKVATAKDNAATWAVATSMRSDIANFKQVSENLSLSGSIVGAARSGAEKASDLITQLKAKVTAAQQGAFDGKTIQADIDSIISQIDSVVQSSAIKGVNLLNGTGTERVVAAVNVVNGASVPSYIDVAKRNLGTETGGELNALRNISVVSRGDQLFNASTVKDITAEQRAMGTTFFAMSAIDYNATADADNNMIKNVAGDVVVNYKDEAGNTRTLAVKNIGAGVTDSDALAKALNADTEFAKLFYAEGTTGAAGSLRLSAKNRMTQSGSFEVLGLDATASTKLTFRTQTATSVANYNGTTFSFQDEVPLSEGETFTFKYKVGAEDRTIVLKATNSLAAGTEYQAHDVVNKIEYRSIKLDDANTRNNLGKYEGDNIAAAVVAALNASADFDTATATGSIYQAVAVGNKVTVKGYNGGSEAVTPSAKGALDDSANKFGGFQPVKTDYANILSVVDEMMGVATKTASAFGAAGSRIDMQKDFMDKLVDTLTAGVGALVDADMSAEAARLQALQVQQQLGTQALSIANQAPQTILALFRG